MSLSLTLPQPYGLQFMEWGRLVSEDLAQLGVTAPDSNEVWFPWACGLLGSPELAAENIPSPEGFTDWQEWACRFLDSLR